MTHSPLSDNAVLPRTNEALIVERLRQIAKDNGDRLIRRGAGYVLVDWATAEVHFPATSTTSTQVGATLLEITKWMGVE